jgi:hypothetical protein
VIQTYFLVGMLASIVDDDWLSAELLADLGRSLNRFCTSLLSCTICAKLIMPSRQALESR